MAPSSPHTRGAHNGGNAYTTTDSLEDLTRLKLGVQRRARTRTAASAFRVALGLATLGLLIYVAIEVYELRRDAAERQNTRPPTTRRFEAAEAIQRGSVVSFTGDGRISVAPEARGTVIASGLGIEAAAPPVVAAPPSAVGDVAGGFRLRTSTAGDVRLVHYQLQISSTSGQTTASAPSEAQVDTAAATSMPLAGVLAGGTWGSTDAALTWHRSSAASSSGALVASVRTQSTSGFQSVLVEEVTDGAWVDRLTSSLAAGDADPAFVSAFGDSDVVVGYPCPGGCCLRLIDVSARAAGPVLSVADGKGLCPATARAVSFNTAAQPTIALGLRPSVLLLRRGTTGVAALQVSQRFGVGNGASPVLPVAVDLAQGSTTSIFRGFLIVIPTAGAVRVRLLRYDATLVRFVDEQQAINVQTASGVTVSIDAAAVAHWSLRALLVLRDPTDVTFVAAVDLNMLGSVSQLVPLADFAGQRMRWLAPSRHGQLLVGVATDAATTTSNSASVVGMTWRGGLQPAGIADASVAAGQSLNVVIDGTVSGLSGLLPGHAYAPGSGGALALAATTPSAHGVIGAAVSKTEFDVLMSLSRMM